MKKNKSLVAIDQLPPELQEKIRNHAAFSIHVDQEKDAIKAGMVDIEKHVSQWLETKTSPRTRDSYAREINRFLSFLAERGVQAILCTAETVDEYIIHLQKDYAKNSIRQKISICSSFFSTLERYGKIQSNPFRGSPIPRRVYKKAGSPVMNKEELNIIIDEFSRKAREPGDKASIINSRESAGRILHVIHYLHTYGLRVGAIPSVELKGEYFTVIEKGNKARSIILKGRYHDYVSSEKKPFAGPGYKPGTIQHAISRVTKKLHAAGKIRHPYSCHDFRHYFAAKLYQETRDVLAVKDALGHSSLAITDVYLQGLGIL
jgi:site-specific recombinase XerD